MGFQGDDPDEIIQVGQGPGMTRREYEAWGKAATIKVMAIDPNPPDANGIRMLSDEQGEAMQGAYDLRFFTAAALPDDALVYGRYLTRGRIVGYFAFVPVKSDS